MRYILFSILLISTSCCYAQQNTEQQSFVQMDSITDVDKMPINAEFSKVLTNSLMLQGHLYGLTIQNNQFDIASDTALFKTLKTEKEILSRSRFYFFYDSTTSVDTVNDIILHLKSGNIDFKVGKLETLTKKFDVPQVPSSGEVIIPSSTQKPIDSSYFVINVLANDEYSISFLNKNTPIKGSVALDKFIQRKRALIKEEKIVLESYDSVKYAAIKPVLDILKKDKYYKFKLLTIPPSGK